MGQYWILKSEPTSYSYDQLERDRETAWDGVKNPLALKHIRAMHKGDEALIYHTGKEKALVGKAKIVSEPYPDPAAGDPKLVVVDIKAVKRLAHTVPLRAVKAEGS
ncbi:MAG: EVE domain-containing protein, partial [Gemmatimonadales bacterium]|nr:EVE domain-containing protein [Gemmatimonadales bacterium]